MKLSIIVLVGVLVGCSGQQPARSPAQQATDVAAAVQCTADHWGLPVTQLALDCFGSDEQAAADIIADVSLLFQKSGGGSSAAALPMEYVKSPSVQAALARKHAASTAAACQQAIDERNAAVSAQAQTCASLGGPDKDPTGACKKLIDAATAATARSVQACH
jgi:hypothetical protein